MSGLPVGWARTTLGEIATLRGEKTSPASVPEAPFIGLEDIEPNTSKFLKVGKASDVKSSVAVFSTGDVLYSRLRPYLNKVAVAEFDGVASAEILVIQPTEATTAEFIRRRIMTPEFLDFAALLDKGDRPRVNYPEISRFPIDLPPLTEQKRIVAKADGLTARTARARADLDRIPTLIARYKQRLLALAFSGELTAAWRAEAKLPSPQFMSIDRIAEGLRYGTAQKCYEEPKGIAVLRIPNVASGRISLDDLKYAELESKELAKLVLREGDILIVRSNGSADLVGRPALVTGEAVGLAYAGYLIRVRPDQSLVSPRFLTFMLEAPSIRKVIEDGARSTSGVHNVNAKELGALEIPIFHLTEQAEITRHIESAFSWLDRIATNHTAAANLLPKLDAAIIAKAFRGELVPQDPTNEPASILLERIEAERAAAPKQVRLREPRTPAPQEIAMLPHSDNDVFEVIPRTPGASAMTKSRQDDDVMGKPYLANLLKEGHSASAQDLFKAADLPVADFYKQLAWEIANRHIRDDDEKLEAL
jgi:type I restriction enzyme S subunit